ncbi:hypothetical protein [Streptomyces sp. NPDC059708]|uniref:hypothetical protein n=1 Tax=Streptomyces sp. NPDC059708 TaxID=3346916 RepID=UPI003698A291
MPTTLAEHLAAALTAAGIQVHPQWDATGTSATITLPGRNISISGVSSDGTATADHGPQLLVILETDDDRIHGHFTALYESYAPDGLSVEADMDAAVNAMLPHL